MYHVIYQPAIGSFYEGAQYSFKELVSARDPWSGWMHYDAGLPEEELPTELDQNVVPDITTPSEEPTTIPSESPAPGNLPDTSPAAQTSPSAVPQGAAPDTASSISKGYTFKVKGTTYIVKDASQKTVAFRKAAGKKIKTAVIPATVKITADGAVQTFRVTEISDKAFAGCSSLKKVTIGKNVTSIGKEAFAKDKNLKKIVIKSSGLKKVGKNAIKGISGKAKISCGKKNVTAYKKLFTGKTGYVKSMKITK